MSQKNFNQKNVYYLPNVKQKTIRTDFSHSYYDYIHSLNSSPFLYFKELWKRVYEAPNKTESSWGVFSLFKDGIITLCSWLPVLSINNLIAIVLIDSLKNLINTKYKQTLRNIFNYGSYNSFTTQFLAYYSKRISYNIFTGFLVSSAAYSTQVFSYHMAMHIITSRILASSHFVVGIYEDQLIYKGFISRKMVAHIGGVLSIVGAILGNLDLAGITLYGVRPGIIGLMMSGLVLICYYYLQKFAIMNRRSLNQYRSQFVPYLINDSNMNR